MGKKLLRKDNTSTHQSTVHDMSDSDSEGELGIFQEPEGFYEPEKEPSFVDYTLQSGLKLDLRLVGHNPLWVSFPSLDGDSSIVRTPHGSSISSDTPQSDAVWRSFDLEGIDSSATFTSLIDGHCVLFSNID
jgi:hypothetical protein